MGWPGCWAHRRWLWLRSSGRKRRYWSRQYWSRHWQWHRVERPCHRIWSWNGRRNRRNQHRNWIWLWIWDWDFEHWPGPLESPRLRVKRKENYEEIELALEANSDTALRNDQAAREDIIHSYI